MLSVTNKLELMNNFLAAADIPIQTVQLANALGIFVYHAEWPNHVSGKIQKDSSNGGSSGFAIYVNKNDPKTRRRFTTAHEIAHYILHESLIGDGIFDDALYRSGLSSAVEAQANKLAADILMPWRLINYYLPRVGADESKMAELFEVSPQAMSIRLQSVL